MHRCLGRREGKGFKGCASMSLSDLGVTFGEAEFAQSQGILSTSLGHRLFRTETAGLVAATAILYECDELGGGTTL